MSGADDMVGTSGAVEDTLSLRLDEAFEDAVLQVQLEHELAGFESVATTRLDNLVAGALEREVERAALVVVCHAEIAEKVLEINRGMSSLLPCTTAVYETEADDYVHVHHLSVTKALRDLGAAPAESSDAVDEMVEMTSERMAVAWEGIESLPTVVEE